MWEKRESSEKFNGLLQVQNYLLRSEKSTGSEGGLNITHMGLVSFGVRGDRVPSLVGIANTRMENQQLKLKLSKVPP